MAVVWKQVAYLDDVVLESDFTAAGDLLVGSGVGSATVLGIGTTLQILRTNAAADALEWAEPPAGGDFMADGTVPMTGDLDFDSNEALDMVIQQVANEAAVAAYATPTVGKVLFATSELSLHICTSAS